MYICIRFYSCIMIDENNFIINCFVKIKFKYIYLLCNNKLKKIENNNYMICPLN